jgi:phosphoglycerate-specific signal transduction histidine kinase
MKTYYLIFSLLLLIVVREIAKQANQSTDINLWFALLALLTLINSGVALFTWLHQINDWLNNKFKLH